MAAMVEESIIAVSNESNDENPWADPAKDTDSIQTSLIASAAPSKAAAPLSLPSQITLPPPEFTPTRSLSPSHVSITAPTGSARSTPGFLARAATVVTRKQSHSVSPDRLSRSSSSDVTALGSGASSGAVSTTASQASQQRKKATKSLTLAEFFTGSSEVVSSFGVSPKKNSTATPTHTRGTSYTRSAASNLSSAAVRLFSRGRSSPTKPSALISPKQDPEENSEGFGTDHDEEFLNLQIDRELFPDACTDFDGISGTAEEAFEALLANAEKLFMRMQIAYQAKHEALMILKERRKEELEQLEEAHERNEHLKSQIDTMGSTVREQEQALQQTIAELQTEKELRRAEAARRIRSVRIVHAQDGSGFKFPGTESEGRSSVDSSEEAFSDDNDDDGGVWSRPGSTSTRSISTMPEDVDGPIFDSGTFSGGLREENMRLKTRVAELEETVDGCLGLVHGL